MSKHKWSERTEERKEVCFFFCSSHNTYIVNHAPCAVCTGSVCFFLSYTQLLLMHMLHTDTLGLDKQQLQSGV